MYPLDEVNRLVLLGPRDRAICAVFHEGDAKLAVRLLGGTGEIGDRLGAVLDATTIAFEDRRE